MLGTRIPFAATSVWTSSCATFVRAPNQLQPTSGPAAPAQSVSDVVPKPEPSGLTQDEIRRIVLDLIG